MTQRGLLVGNLSKNLQYNELLIKKPNELLQEQSHLVLFRVSPGVIEREFCGSMILILTHSLKV
jgi:hypothetical protein